MYETSAVGPTMSMVAHSIKTASQSVEKYQIQLSTNQKEIQYSGLGDLASSYSSIESFLEKNNAQVDNTLFVGADFSIVQNTTESLRYYAEKFSTLAGQAKRDELPGFDYQKSSKYTLNLVRDILNTKTERYLCSGSVINEAPVDLSSLPDPATYHLDDTDDIPVDPNNPQDKPAYYKGDNNPQQLHIDNQNLEMSFTANEPGPQRLIRALHLLSTTDTNAGNYKQVVDEVVRLSKLAVNDFRNIESRLGEISGSIKTAKDNILSQNVGFSKQLQDINGINKNEAAIQAMSAINLVNINNQIAAQILKSTGEACSRFFAASA
ncbi:MAG: hypothetical protein Q8K37_00240 [Alphaproteobacteria bacterium]|nr:hypothetical protein [Alphaproteobacteria bacterium]